MESIFLKRINELCQQRGISQADLADTLGFNRTNFQKWGVSTSPSIDKVQKLANYFNVSIDYLTGNSDVPQSADTILKDTDIISLQRAKFLIPDEDQELWDNSMEMLRRTFDRAFNNGDKT